MHFIREKHVLRRGKWGHERAWTTHQPHVARMDVFFLGPSGERQKFTKSEDDLRYLQHPSRPLRSRRAGFPAMSDELVIKPEAKAPSMDTSVGTIGSSHASQLTSSRRYLCS